MPTSFSPSPSGNFENRHGTLFRLRLSFLTFFKVALLANFNKAVELRFQIMLDQQLEDIFSTTSAIYTLGLILLVWGQMT
jgi:hypothetical protein